MITKVPDARLGEAVTLLVDTLNTEGLEEICRSVLPKHWVPRHILTATPLPTTGTGKPARAEAEKLASNILKNDNSEI